MLCYIKRSRPLLLRTECMRILVSLFYLHLYLHLCHLLSSESLLLFQGLEVLIVALLEFIDAKVRLCVQFHDGFVAFSAVISSLHSLGLVVR